MNRGIISLARAIVYEESPCTYCINVNICKKKRMACESFKNYCETGEMKGSKKPNTIIYKGIFNVGIGST